MNPVVEEELKHLVVLVDMPLQLRLKTASMERCPFSNRGPNPHSAGKTAVSNYRTSDSGGTMQI